MHGLTVKQTPSFQHLFFRKHLLLSSIKHLIRLFLWGENSPRSFQAKDETPFEVFSLVKMKHKMLTLKWTINSKLVVDPNVFLSAAHPSDITVCLSS